MRFELSCIVGICVALVPCHVKGEVLTLERTEILWREANIDLKLARHGINSAVGDVTTADRRENPNFSLNDILQLLNDNPEIYDLNKQYAGVNWYRNHLDDLKTITAEQTKIKHD